MSVTVTNLIQGPATIWAAIFGSTEPATVSTAIASPWIDLGATQDGVEVTVELSYSELEADQVVDVPGQTISKRQTKLKTNLAEVTLANWALAQNELAATVATNTFTPTNGTAAFVPNYTALILEGIAPGGFKRRVIARKCLQLGNPGQTYKKDGQNLIPVEWGSHYVSASIAPYIIQDAIV